MSGQDYYQPPSGSPPGHRATQGHHFGSNNPFASAQDQNPWQDQQGHTPQTQTATGTSLGGLPHDQHYDQPPPGPPPGHAAKRTDTFKESDFVPADERGEQREALEQFEMNKGSQSKEDREMEALQREFPNVDGSLIAALYSDAGSFGATKEMLEEIAKGQ
ncbi:hypothetical protein EJ03DRAFT_328532 [Teratosphaeria nubilosa]|uniref:CUE domain-containing protein n=1 Tax=Teratosphaeria nubilosa TaxID=161662 RepID=A0A6G1L5F5_9PEZI|nr:hypothetical protein EJ03DRAFT_328532 [Teratosphaeria nubilosa]